jgi:hypothetical protein
MSDLQLDRSETLILTATADGVVVTYRLPDEVESRPSAPLGRAAETGTIGPVALNERERALIAHWRREIDRPDLAALIETVRRRG